MNNVNNEDVLMVCELTMLQQGDGKEAAAASDAAGAKADQQATPAGKQQQPQQAQQQLTPQHPRAMGGVLKQLTPGPTPSPSEE